MSDYSHRIVRNNGVEGELISGGDVLKLGMGGIFWINEKGSYANHGAKKYNNAQFNDAKSGYLGHEIFLLPGQTLPEHHHMGGAEGYGTYHNHVTFSKPGMSFGCTGHS